MTQAFPILPAIQPARAHGGVRATFRHDGAKTAVFKIEERDGYRMRFPRGGIGCEGVILNTGGGVVAGDRIVHNVECGDGADVTITAPSAERIYRSEGDYAGIDVQFTLAPKARLAWLPQQTILYDNARLTREFHIEMAADSSALLAETTVFGRKGMSEAVTQGAWIDRWRVRRSGRMVFAKNNRFDGPIAELLMRSAIGGGAHILATVLYVAPDAESRLASVRAALVDAQGIGASAWNGLLYIRAVSADFEVLRRTLGQAIVAIRGVAMPRVWSA
ncbi:MAG: urease accessory protein UreD [Hyphomicrobiales bacterium]|nr:urease accessory protein UreD [Hyphomicrobiales bacterium]